MKLKNNNTNSNENNNVVESKSLVKFDESQVTVSTNDSKTNFEVYTVKNSKLVVDVKLSAEKDLTADEEPYGQYENIIMDLYVNDVKKESVKIGRYFACKDANDCDIMDASATPINNMIDKSSFGTIKGDDNKYYLYLDVDHNDSDIYIFDEDGNILGTNGITFYGSKASQNSFELSKDCVTYKYGKAYDGENSEKRLGTHFFQEDAIYYLVASKYDDESDYANEYKLTIVNGKIKKEKINTCKVQMYGEKGAAKYEDMAENEQ